MLLPDGRFIRLLSGPLGFLCRGAIVCDQTGFEGVDGLRISANGRLGFDALEEVVLETFGEHEFGEDRRIHIVADAARLCYCESQVQCVEEPFYLAGIPVCALGERQRQLVGKYESVLDLG